MKTLSAQLDDPAVASVLVQERGTGGSPGSENLQETILDALGVALRYAANLTDPTFRRKAEARLLRSNVKGSRVAGIKGPDDVVSMFSSTTNWQTVDANLEDKDIIVYQGVLPSKFKDRAFTAYSTAREIRAHFGQPGTDSIKMIKGYQGDDEYYLGTMTEMPTNVLTVQIKRDQDGALFVHQWFAGVEVSSRRVRRDPGDDIVRCAIKLQPDEERRLKHESARTDVRFRRRNG